MDESNFFLDKKYFISWKIHEWSIIIEIGFVLLFKTKKWRVTILNYDGKEKD